MANFKLTQTGEQIQADLNLLDSNTATNGQVLTANGTGGASWQNASGGSQPTTFTVTINNVVQSYWGFLDIISYENGIFTLHSFSGIGNYTFNNVLLCYYSEAAPYSISIPPANKIVLHDSGSKITCLITSDCEINIAGGGGTGV